MTYLEQVQTGVDWIEENLDHDITLGEVAAAASLSQWHFQRIFKALTNETLKTYIRSRRMAKAMERLLDRNSRIIEIALGAGYDSQESFTRAFKKQFGMTPNEYRTLGNEKLFLKKVKFDADYLRHVGANISLSPDIYDQKQMTLVGIKTCFYSVDSEKNNIGEKLPSLWDAFMERMEEIGSTIPGVCYGVVQQTKDRTDELEYYAAVEVSDPSDVPNGMVSVEVPAGTYAKFVHKGPGERVNDTVNYVYSSWLLQSGMRHTYAADLEIYELDSDFDSGYSVLYYAIPVERRPH